MCFLKLILPASLEIAGTCQGEVAGCPREGDPSIREASFPHLETVDAPQGQAGEGTGLGLAGLPTQLCITPVHRREAQRFCTSPGSILNQPRAHHRPGERDAHRSHVSTEAVRHRPLCRCREDTAQKNKREGNVRGDHEAVQREGGGAASSGGARGRCPVDRRSEGRATAGQVSVPSKGQTPQGAPRVISRLS